MKCPKCGLFHSDSTSICPNQAVSSAATSSGRQPQARLLEFRVQPKKELPQAPPSDLAWRAEIRERVRALRAKRELEAELALAMSREKGKEKPSTKQLRLPIETAIQSRPQPARREHPVLEAALKRLEKAHPSIASPHPVSSSGLNASGGSITAGRGAATALAPIIEDSRESTIPISRSRPAVQPEVQSPLISAVTELERQSLEVAGELSFGQIEQSEIDSRLDELIDFDPAIFNDAAPLKLRALGGVVDLIAVTITCIPFLALAELADVNYHDALTRSMIVVMLASVLVGYFAIAVGVTGKTVGMHFAGIRVVDYLSRLQPNFVQTTLRAFGYLFAAAPLMAGLFWILIDDEHRGWHDHLSSTAVVQDR